MIISNVDLRRQWQQATGNKQRQRRWQQQFQQQWQIWKKRKTECEETKTINFYHWYLENLRYIAQRQQQQQPKITNANSQIGIFGENGVDIVDDFLTHVMIFVVHFEPLYVCVCFSSSRFGLCSRERFVKHLNGSNP